MKIKKYNQLNEDNDLDNDFKTKLEPITKKYFIFFNQQNVIIFAKIINKTTPYIFWKHIGYIDKDTKDIMPKISKNPTFDRYEWIDIIHKSYKDQEYNMIYQTNSYRKLLKQFDFGFKSEVNKYNL